MPDLFDKYAHVRSNTFNPMIYAYSDMIPSHLGMLKVGYTSVDVDERVAQQFPVKTPDGKKPYIIRLRERAITDDGEYFDDHAVHRALEKRGFPRLNNSEWFRCTISDVQSAIIAVKTKSLNVENRTQTFKPRPEQQKAIDATKRYFTQEKRDNPNSSPKFLWNAKMRFGKTFASYELAKSMGLKKILVLTFKPAVESAWEEDLMGHVDFEGWQFYSRNSSKLLSQLDMTRPIVCFGSFQDYLGVDKATGGIKAKNEWVHTMNWDLVIFDEYHFGAWRDNANKLFDNGDEESDVNFDMEKYQKEESGNAYNESFLPITTSYYLFLSGTPFRALNSGEFIEEQIFNWTYADEQKAKYEWNLKNGPNPYAPLPKMVLMTYNMPEEITKVAMNTELNEFDLNVFFSAESKTKDPKDSQFIYKSYVQKWLDLIRGSHLPTSIDDLKLGGNQRPVMPFSDVRMLNILTHTLWFLPSVASCFAMANLLKEKQNVFYHDYTINVCAGTGAGVGLAAVKPVKESMIDPLKSKTITLSCGKLTTGVTIKPWTGVFMLRNLNSPETYFQTAFRVQSPWLEKNDDGTSTIMKHECYIFDFALNRALKQIADYSTRLNVNESNPEKKVGEFVNFLPVLAYDGSAMKEVNATEILDLTMAGTSATLLARRWESALLVNVTNDILAKLLANEDALNALMNIEGFRSLNSDIQTIINKSEAVKKAKKEGTAKTDKEKKELSKEEKEYKSKRKEIQEKLIKFATRIPIFMYLTDYREYCLKDVITQLEPGLFKAVTGLSTKDFELLVSLGLFNDSLMNEAIYKFKRYEDASLEYTGIRKHSDKESVGLFSTVISAEDYELMAEQQKESMHRKGVYQPTKEIIKNIPKVEKNKQVSKPKTASKTVFSKPEFEKTVQNSPTLTKTEISSVQARTNSIISSKKKRRIVIHKGDKVFHKVFGTGYVTNVDGDTLVIEFNDGGVKRFKNPDAFNNGFLECIN